MIDEFIKQKEMDFVEEPDGGSFWGGVDTYAEHKFELFLKGDVTGPSQAHIDKYNSLLENLERIVVDIQARLKSHFMAQGDDGWKRFEGAPVEIDIIGIDEQKSKGDLDILASVRGKGFIFKKRLHFCASVRDNQVTDLEV